MDDLAVLLFAGGGGGGGPFFPDFPDFKTRWRWVVAVAVVRVVAETAIPSKLPAAAANNAAAATIKTPVWGILIIIVIVIKYCSTVSFSQINLQ